MGIERSFMGVLVDGLLIRGLFIHDLGVLGDSELSDFSDSNWRDFKVPFLEDL